MREASMYLNTNGIAISKERFDKVYTYYSGLFAKACYKLYDLGYLSSPSEFDVEELRSSYFTSNDFKDKIGIFENYNEGVYMLNWRVAEYALSVYKDDEDFVEVTKSLRDVLKAKEALTALDLAYTKVNLKKKAQVVVTPRLNVSSTVENCSQVPLDNFALQECFVRTEDTHLVYFDTRDEVIKLLCKKIGMQDDEYNQHILSGQSFFLDGISAKEEYNYVDLIMSCDLNLTGKYGKKLQKYITNYYQTNAQQLKARISCIKFEDKIFIECLNSRIERIREKRREVKSLGGRDFYVTKDYVIFEIPNFCNDRKESYFENGFIVGNYAMDYLTYEELDKVNCLLGLAGEYISKDDVKALGYQAFGKPIIMHRFSRNSKGELKDSVKEYYPIYNVSMLTEATKDMELLRQKTLKPKVGSEIEVIFSDIQVFYQQFGVTSKSDLFKEIRASVLEDYELTFGTSLQVGKKSYSSLVSDLTCALIFMECGYPDYELCFDSYEFVTDEIYLKACYDATIKFKQIYG